MGDILKGNPPGHVTGETGTSSLSGSGNNPTDLASGAGKHRAVGLNPRLLRRLTVSRQFTAKIPDARRAFKQLEIKGKNSEPGNQFFQEYGTGNTIDMIDRPYERFFACSLRLPPSPK